MALGQETKESNQSKRKPLVLITASHSAIGFQTARQFQKQVFGKLQLRRLQQFLLLCQKRSRSLAGSAEERRTTRVGHYANIADVARANIPKRGASTLEIGSKRRVLGHADRN